jgi:FhuF 2Fe-2S C-terminal domain
MANRGQIARRRRPRQRQATVSDVTLSLGRPASARRVRAALAGTAQLGPFFQLEVRGNGPDPGWLSAAELCRDGLAGLVASTARQLGTDQTRVAASILHQGFAARLWSPALACALLAGVVPDLTSLVVSMAPSIRLALADAAGWQAGSAAELAEQIAAAVAAPLAGLAGALPVPLADGLVRGNSASAMAGALGVLARARPDRRESAAALAAALLRTPDLAGAGRLTGSALAFRRHSCCLYYRVPGGGLCGDCCFDRPPSAGG